MQSKIILIVLQVQNCFFRSISVIISNKILLILFSKVVWGALQAPPVGSGAEPRKPKHF